MSAEMRVDLRGFENGLRAWARGMGVDMPTAVRTQAVLLVKSIVKLLPPKSNAQGRKAIAGDVRRSADPLFEKAQPNNEKIAQLMAAGDTQRLEGIFGNSQALAGYRIEPFSASLHRRDGKGKVKRSRKVVVTDRRAWQDFLKKQQLKVGKAKGAFAGTLSRLGQPVPSWLARHRDEGATVDRTRSDKRKPMVRIIARPRHLRNLGIDRIIGVGLRQRAKAMKSHVNRATRARAKGAGFKVSLIR